MSKISLPLQYQLLVVPGIMLLLFGLLTTYSLYQQRQYRLQNENIQQWAQITDTLYDAGKAAGELKNILNDVAEGISEIESPHLAYLEQYRVLHASLNCRICLEHLSESTKTFLHEYIDALNYKDNLQPEVRLPVINALIQRLNHTYKSLLAQKRAAYMDYYQSMQESAPRMMGFTIAISLVCMLLASVLTLVSWRSVTGRLQALTSDLETWQNSDSDMIAPPFAVHDSVDRLRQCLWAMSKQTRTGASLRNVVEASEKESKRIAMEMHDQTLAEVTTINRQLQTIFETCPKQLGEQLAAVQQNLNLLTANIRQIIDDLHPHTLSLLGLQAAVQSLLQKRTQYDGAPPYYVRIDEASSKSLPPSHTIHIYRIISEAITNALRHAHCKHLEVVMVPNNGMIMLTIEDDGVGMPEQIRQLHSGGGHGLLNIRTRAAALKAEVIWEKSRFNQGTRLTLHIPTDAIYD